MAYGDARYIIFSVIAVMFIGLWQSISYRDKV